MIWRKRSRGCIECDSPHPLRRFTADFRFSGFGDVVRPRGDGDLIRPELKFPG
jgi:hypothetical protein